MHNDKVLVVDDDLSVQTYLHDMLGSHGYSVSCLDSGRHVLEHMKPPERPSVVLLDLLMPRTDGMEVLAQIRGCSRPVPVIVMSGIGHARSIVTAMRMGASDYLVKPFEDDELALTLRPTGLV